MGTSEKATVPAQRGRQYPPKQYPAQLILVTTEAQERFARAYAAVRGVSVTAVLRDLVQSGIDSLDPAIRAQIETAAEDDGEGVDAG